MRISAPLTALGHIVRDYVAPFLFAVTAVIAWRFDDAIANNSSITSAALLQPESEEDDRAISGTMIGGLDLAAGTESEQRVASLLYADDFVAESDNWQFEGTGASFSGGKLHMYGRKVSAWFKQKLSGNVMVEYDIEMLRSALTRSPTKTESMNSFFMATDPANPAHFFAGSAARSDGTFSKYDGLDLYYVGYGSNQNTTSRFRKYKNGVRQILTEYTVQPNLLDEPGRTYHVRQVQYEGTFEYWVDENDGRGLRKIVDYNDATDGDDNGPPYTSGYFAFRGAGGNYNADNFRVYRLEPRANVSSPSP